MSVDEGLSHTRRAHAEGHKKKKKTRQKRSQREKEVFSDVFSALNYSLFYKGHKTGRKQMIIRKVSMSHNRYKVSQFNKMRHVLRILAGI